MTAVFNPAKDKLHPDLYKIGFGNKYFFGFPFKDIFSITLPLGIFAPSIFATLSNASPKASSIVVPILL